MPKSVKAQRDRWEKIKSRNDQTINEFLKDRNVFENYKNETKGKLLTIEMLDKEYSESSVKSNVEGTRDEELVADI